MPTPDPIPTPTPSAASPGAGRVLIRFRPTAELTRYIRRGIDTEDGRETYPITPELARELIRAHPNNWALEPGEAGRLYGLLNGAKIQGEK